MNFNDDSNTLKIYVISDSIGETGELIAKATVKQFETMNYTINRFPYHNSVEQIEPVLERAAKDKKSLVVYTNVDTETRAFIKQKKKDFSLNMVDVMGPPLAEMEEVLGYEPVREPGLIRRLDDNYFKKVEAIEFAVKYDDGKDPRGISQADICLVGISRTSKTPLSMYLANKLYKVANVPLVPEVPAPEEIFKKDPRQVFGLIAKPEKLFDIREERLKAMGLNSSAKYANVKRIREEVQYSIDIIEEIGCVMIDVSNKAIEETAEIINRHMKKIK